MSTPRVVQATLKFCVQIRTLLWRYLDGAGGEDDADSGLAGYFKQLLERRVYSGNRAQGRKRSSVGGMNVLILVEAANFLCGSPRVTDGNGRSALRHPLPRGSDCVGRSNGNESNALCFPVLGFGRQAWLLSKMRANDEGSIKEV